MEPTWQANKSLILHKWQPGLQAIKFNPRRILIWIKIFHLPVEYWNPECLSHITSGVGIPLYTDSLKEKQKWLGFEGLKVCVEIEANSPLPTTISVELRKDVYLENKMKEKPTEQVGDVNKEQKMSNGAPLSPLQPQGYNSVNVSLQNEKIRPEPNPMGSSLRSQVMVPVNSSSNERIGIVRKNLWSNLHSLKSQIGDQPCLIGGDFNIVKGPDERSEDFQFKALKLDKILVNPVRFDCFPPIGVEFLPPSVSDHATSFMFSQVEVEMVRDYHKEKGVARCTIKVDLMKAYDSIQLTIDIGKLSSRDCKPLIDKISARIHSRSARRLAFAVIKQIEKSFNSYLWKGIDTGAKGAKVAWDRLEIRAKHDECLSGNWCGILLPFLNTHLFSETDHLFFECSITGRIWSQMLGFCDFHQAISSWSECLQWGLRILKMGGVKAIFFKLVYHIWLQRNASVYSSNSLSEEAIKASFE
uniref:DUF4283 domain-containing protein n=1 Tax=Quercus lobata TaxID=97700 RepID=A0A7N2RCI6_QUELO